MKHVTTLARFPSPPGSSMGFLRYEIYEDPKIINSYPWVVHGYPWIVHPLEIHWKSKEINRNSRENLWRSLDIHGTRMDILENRWIAMGYPLLVMENPWRLAMDWAFDPENWSLHLIRNWWLCFWLSEFILSSQLLSHFGVFELVDLIYCFCKCGSRKTKKFTKGISRLINGICLCIIASSAE